MQDDSDPRPAETALPSWRQRPRPIGFEISYRIEGDELVVDSTRKIDRVRLGAVEEMRFTFAPGNLSTRGYRTRLKLTDGKTITFGNLSWRSLTDLDRDDPGYRAFVTELAASVARANPRCRFVAGNPTLLWFGFTAVALISVVMLAGFVLRAWQKGAWAAGLLGIGVLAVSAWQIWPMVKLNHPRDLASGEVPAELMP